MSFAGVSEIQSREVSWCGSLRDLEAVQSAVLHCWWVLWQGSKWLYRRCWFPAFYNSHIRSRIWCRNTLAAKMRCMTESVKSGILRFCNAFANQFNFSTAELHAPTTLKVRRSTSYSTAKPWTASTATTFASTRRVEGFQGNFTFSNASGTFGVGVGSFGLVFVILPCSCFSRLFSHCWKAECQALLWRLFGGNRLCPQS